MHKNIIEILTLEQAAELYENGIALEVHDGKEIKIVREKPLSPTKQNRD